jgi:hypothetical protein
MDNSILQIAGTLGVGAFLAVIIFIFALKYIRSMEDRLRDDRKFMEDRLTGLLKDDQRCRDENTRALAGLTAAIGRINGKANL